MTACNTTTHLTGLNPAGMALTEDYLFVANSNWYSLSNGDSVHVYDLQDMSVVAQLTHVRFAAPYRLAKHPIKDIVFVCNSNGTSVTVLDGTTLRVLIDIDGFDGPSTCDVVTRSDGKHFGFVTSYGSSVGATSGMGSEVRVMDLDNYTVRQSIGVDLAPSAVKMYNGANKVLCVITYGNGNPGNGTMQFINADTFTLEPTKIFGLSGPFGIDFSDRYAFVTEFGSNNFDPVGNSISVVDVEERVLLRKVLSGFQPAGMAILDKKLGLYTNYNTVYSHKNDNDSLTAGQGLLRFFWTAELATAVTAKEDEAKPKMTVKVLPMSVPVPAGPSQVMVSPDNKKVFVTCFQGNCVVVVPTNQLPADCSHHVDPHNEQK